MENRLELFRQWDAAGRRENGEMWDMMVNDRTGKFIPKGQELELGMDCHDGFAVGNDGVNEYVMTYPTMKEVMDSPRMKNRIENYVGQAVDDTGICTGDIALTFGEVVQMQGWRQAAKEAEDLIAHTPDWMMQAAFERVKPMVEKYNEEVVVPQVKEIDNRFLTGLTAIAKSKGYDDYKQLINMALKPGPKTDEEKKVLQSVQERIDRMRPYIDAAKEAVHEKLKDFRSRELAAGIRQIRQGMERMSDIRLVRHTNGDRSVRCRIDGVQQPMRKLERELMVQVKENEPESIRAAAARSFMADILPGQAEQQLRQRNRGMAR